MSNHNPANGLVRRGTRLPHIVDKYRSYPQDIVYHIVSDKSSFASDFIAFLIATSDIVPRFVLFAQVV